MNWRSRQTFWATVIAVLVLISIPSVDWIDALREYAHFATGWQPTPLKPTVTTFTPRDHPGDEEILELSPFEFKHRAAKAKSVELVGDFNGWKPGLLKMRKRSDGIWSLVLPLRPGPHKYLFLEDGEPVIDPATDTGTGPEGRRVSLRTVK